MLLSLMLTFASLDPSLQAQAQTQVTQTASRLVGYSRPSFVEQLERSREKMNAWASVEGLDEEIKQKMLDCIRQMDEATQKLKELIKAQPVVDSSDTESWMLDFDNPEPPAIFDEAELATTPKFEPATFEDTVRELNRLPKELEERVRWAKAQIGVK